MPNEDKQNKVSVRRYVEFQFRMPEGVDLTRLEPEENGELWCVEVPEQHVKEVAAIVEELVYRLRGQTLPVERNF